MKQEKLKITILYDNCTLKKGLKSAWGFSALIEHQGGTLLFDTGAKTDILLANMKVLGVNPKKITDIFISHNHWDHLGGLFGFLNVNHKVKVWLPADCSTTYAAEVRASGAECVRLSKSSKISKDIYSSGEMGKKIREQFLIVETADGLGLITGCSHPGIVAMARRVKQVFKKEIALIVGGFHLGSLSAAKTRKIAQQLKDLGIKKIVPCHCTGEKAMSIIKSVFADNFMAVGVGSIC
ncbi:MBL fold metallo-hydrolase [Candidatus Saganbacteria bacterium CG08_land_8_20_14_0_20_45_16]|uniref:MBL fold metallo-hydrolase n=1 Tax=Candidatus Saganbacteria bacterium CG08_land_8_20_14_0_20_45_16 TaxID=2014293 RepID=A0A2H0XUY2_UNCSA|nr:MAG: MBL fold metallo-hydrolase [Candidatus Saganbacteria bacterium CG08_land_8_20_14_0_20_45_16]